MASPQSNPTLSPPTVPTSPLPPSGTTLKMDSAVPDSKVIDYTSIAVLIGGPILLLMPPRKLDLYTFSLCSLWVFSASHQVQRRSGKGLLEWAAERRIAKQQQLSSSPLSQGSTSISSPGAASTSSQLSSRIEHASQARIISDAWRDNVRGRRHDPWTEKGAILGFDGQVRAGQMGVLDGVTSGGRPSTTAGGVEGEESEGGVKGMVRDLWYGEENPADWKEKRMAEERELAAQGASVGDRILSQIYDAWNQVRTEGEKVERETEVLERRAREEVIGKEKRM